MRAVCANCGRISVTALSERLFAEHPQCVRTGLPPPRKPRIASQEGPHTPTWPDLAGRAADRLRDGP